MNKVNFFEENDPNKVSIQVAKKKVTEEVTEIEIDENEEPVETVETVEEVIVTEAKPEEADEEVSVEMDEEVDGVIESEDAVKVVITKKTTTETVEEVTVDDVELFDNEENANTAEAPARNVSDHPVKEWSASDFQKGAEEYVHDNGEFDWEAKEAEIEAAINRDFDETYADVDLPFYKRAWFWIVAILVVAVAVVAVLINNGTIPNPVELLSYDPETVTIQTEDKEEQVNAQQFILPEGAVVKEASDGTWGVYESTTLLTSYNGIASNGYGTWYIKDGLVDFDFTGKVTINGKTYQVEKGRVNITSNEPEETTTQSTEGMAYNEGTEIQEVARDRANELLDEMSYSREWLIAQLVSDGYNSEDATWAVDNTSTNWNYQAYLKAREYLAITSFSHQDMVDQLIFEGFTEEQAEYGASRASL